MATHSSVLAWRIPGKGEPGGLPFMGAHRVGHDWSDLAAAAATWNTHFLPLTQLHLACLPDICLAVHSSRFYSSCPSTPLQTHSMFSSRGSSDCHHQRHCHHTCSSSCPHSQIDGKLPGGGSVRPSKWTETFPWRRQWQSTPVLLPGKSHGQRSLVGYSPWGRRVGHNFTFNFTFSFTSPGGGSVCPAKLLQSCPTLCDSMDCSLPGSLSMGFSRQEYWSGLTFPSPGDLPDPGNQTCISCVSCIAGRFFTTEPPGKSRGGGGEYIYIF